MTRLGDPRSIVAIDPTDRGLALVFFERGNVLDWGTWRDDGNELALLDRLLDGCAADVLVLEDADAQGCRRRPRIRELLRAMEHHARRRGTAVVTIPRDDVRRQWAKRNVRMKYDMAAAITAQFPDMETILPKVRKVYRSEDARVQIFDAASLALHAFGVEERAET